MNNPFSYIRLQVFPARGAAFIGRTEQLKRVVENLTSDSPKHISIYGLPHIGKTSFLIKLKETLENRENYLTTMATFSEGDFNNSLWYILYAIADEAPQVTHICDCLEKNADNLRLIGAIRECLSILTAENIRTVLFLDEFERILGANLESSDTVRSGWSQSEYRLFLDLLLDKSLNLVCVTASRPKMSNILYRYKPAINPFISFLIYGFDDQEMSEYFTILETHGAKLNGASIRDNSNTRHFNELLKVCGRNPYLLTVMGNELFRNTIRDEVSAAKSVKELFEGCKEDFINYFNEIIRFMATEEQKKMRSFSHIVKCYFGQFEDYQDIKERCIALGYLELAAKKSPYTYKQKVFPFIDSDNKFEVRNENGTLLTAEEKRRTELVYTTVCPLFTDYLFSIREPSGRCKIIPLDIIEDQRDLLTGLIHTMRDITALEFSEAFSNGWNDHLAQSYCFSRQIDQNNCEEGLIYVNTAEMQRNKRYSAWRKLGPNLTRTFPKPPRPGRQGTREQVIYQEYLNEMQNVANLWPTLVPTSPIYVSSVSLNFVCEELIENSSDMASIDPLNLVDQTQIFLNFWNSQSGPSFAKYFSILPNGQTQLSNMLSALKDARDRISHFSRSRVSPQRTERDKIYCRQLLKGIYYYLFSGNCCPAGDLSETPGV